MLRFMMVVCLWLIVCQPLLSYNKGETDEVVFTFRHHAIGMRYITCLYQHENEKVYLPLTALLSLFEIPYRYNQDLFMLTGDFPDANSPFYIQTQVPEIGTGNNKNRIRSNQLIRSQTEFFIDPELLSVYFGLDFTISISDLHITMKSRHELPVEARMKREAARKGMTPNSTEKLDYPLLFGRKHSILGGAMAEYSLTGGINAESAYFNYIINGGIELMGGQADATVYGYHSTNGSSLPGIHQLQWKYAFKPNPWISTISIGQLHSSGLWRQPYRGINLTNNPIEARQINDFFPLDGYTEPDAEVELYMNEKLYSFIRADESGYYRFEVPLNYGTSNIRLQIYTPSGTQRTITRRIQVPYHFLPAGKLSYEIQAGQQDRYFEDDKKNEFFGHARLGYGLTQWLTAGIGSQYTGTEFNPDDMLMYGTISARIAKQFLLHADIAPDAFTSIAGSVVFPNFTGIQGRYVHYHSIGFYNTRGVSQEWNAGFYVPVTHFGVQAGFRLGIEQNIFESFNTTMIRADWNARFNKIQFRLGYRDQISRNSEYLLTGQGLLTASASYGIPRSKSVPELFRGASIRSQMTFHTGLKNLQQVDFNFSRPLGHRGRVYVQSSFYPGSGKYNLQLGVNLDLQKVRTATYLNYAHGGINVRKQISGSVLADIPNRNVQLSSSSTSGKAAASFLLFVDQNSNGRYDAGEALLPYAAVKLDRPAQISVGKDSIVRITQLQSFLQYNVIIDRNAIPNPSLVPSVTTFSFVTDPNRFKTIEIPFYRTGIADGAVEIKQEDGKITPVSGLRLRLKNIKDDVEIETLTFSDGSFYIMDIPPGTYEIFPDPNQLDFMGVIASPEKLEIVIQSNANGDFVEGLKIMLLSKHNE